MSHIRCIPLYAVYMRRHAWLLDRTCSVHLRTKNTLNLLYVAIDLLNMCPHDVNNMSNHSIKKKEATNQASKPTDQNKQSSQLDNTNPTQTKALSTPHKLRDPTSFPFKAQPGHGVVHLLPLVARFSIKGGQEDFPRRGHRGEEGEAQHGEARRGEKAEGLEGKEGRGQQRLMRFKGGKEECMIKHGLVVVVCFS